MLKEATYQEEQKFFSPAGRVYLKHIDTGLQCYMDYECVLYERFKLIDRTTEEVMSLFLSIDELVARPISSAH